MSELIFDVFEKYDRNPLILLSDCINFFWFNFNKIQWIFTWPWSVSSPQYHVFSSLFALIVNHPDPLLSHLTEANPHWKQMGFHRTKKANFSWLYAWYFSCRWSPLMSRHQNLVLFLAILCPHQNRLPKSQQLTWDRFFMEGKEIANSRQIQRAIQIYLITWKKVKWIKSL